jgi:hypothetical protein
MRARATATAVVFLLALPWFGKHINSSDHLPHIRIAFGIPEGKGVPPHPLYHASLLLFCGHDQLAAPGIAAFVLAAAVAARAYLTAGMLTEGGRGSVLSVTALCVALALAMVPPNWWGRDQIVGQLSPNIWHNPTFIFAMPFCLATFVFGTRMLETPTVRLAFLTGMFLALSLLAKPNYALAFLPCFGPTLLLSLWQAVRTSVLDMKTTGAILVAVFVPAALVLVWQVIWFRGNALVSFSPLNSWLKHTPSIWKSVLISIPYPVAVAVCYPRQINEDRPMILAWGTLGVAIALAASLAEDLGTLEFNWGWALHMANAVLFVASTAFLMRQRSGVRQVVCLGLLGLNVLAGVIYLYTYNL